MSLLRPCPDGVLLGIRVTPKSARNEVTGQTEGADGSVSLQVRVTAQPEKGKANKAVIQTLARSLGLAKTDLTIVSGETARHKTVHINRPRGQIAPIIDELIRARNS